MYEMKFFHAEVKSFSAKEFCFIDVTRSEIKVNVFSDESNMRDMPTKREQMNDADDRLFYNIYYEINTMCCNAF